MSKVLKVSSSGYYTWFKTEKNREVKMTSLDCEIIEVF